MDSDAIGKIILGIIISLAIYGAGNISYKIYKLITNLFGSQQVKTKNRYLE